MASIQRNSWGWASGIALESKIPSAKKKRYLKKGKSAKVMSKKLVGKKRRPGYLLGFI
jgi:hypothetical protein